MRFAFIASRIENTGGFRILNQIVNLLKDSGGHYVDLYCSGAAKNNNLQDKVLYKLYAPRIKDALASELQSVDFSQYDLIITDGLAGLHETELIDHPKKYHLCQMYDKFLFPDDKVIIDRLYRSANFIVYCDALAKILKKTYPCAKIEKLNLGVDYGPFQDFNFPKVPKQLAFMVARHAYIKGVDLAQEVFNLAKANDWKTILIHGHEGIPIIADEAYLNPEFNLKCKLINESTIFLNTSVFETWCLAVCEAMALGTPVVATNSRGIMEYANEQNSVIINDRSATTLWQEIQSLAENPQRYQAIKDAGRATISQLDWRFRKWEAITLLERLAR